MRMDAGLVKPIAMAHVPVRYLLSKYMRGKRKSTGEGEDSGPIFVPSSALMRNDSDQGRIPPRDEIDDSVSQMKLEC